MPLSRRVIRKSFSDSRKTIKKIRKLPLDFFIPAPDSVIGVDDSSIEPMSISTTLKKQIKSSIDHVDAAMDLIYKNKAINSYSIYTLLRSSIEMSSTLLWMIKPEDREERIKRYMRFRNSNFDYLDKFHGDFQSEASSDLGMSIGVARANGVAIVLNSFPNLNENSLMTSKYTLTNDVFPFVTALDIDLKIEEFDLFSQWKLGSGIAHGYDWGHDFLFEEKGEIDIKKLKWTSLELDPLTSSIIAATTVRLIIICIKEYIRLSGRENLLSIEFTK